MLQYGEAPTQEMMFALRMLMVKYNLSPGDIMQVLCALDKENEKAP